MPILSVNEMIERIDSVEIDAVRALAAELFTPSRLSAAGVGPAESGVPRGDRAARSAPREAPERGAMIKVAVAGAAGRMGQTVCEAVLGAADMELVGRADPLLDTTLADVLARRRGGRRLHRSPTRRSRTRSQCVRAGVHVVIGTTGFDPAPLQEQCAAARDGRRRARTC